MDKNDIDDLNKFVADLDAMIAALTILEAKYMPERYIRRPLRDAKECFKSATASILRAAEEIEGLDNG